MATLKKNVWFAAVNKNGNIVQSPISEMAIMSRSKQCAYDEVSLYAKELKPKTNKITIEKIDIGKF